MPKIITGNALVSRVSPELLELLEASSSPATRKALKSDIRIYCSWSSETPPLPASELAIAEFIAAFSKTRTVSTITRYLSSISRAHDMAEWPNPIRSELIRTTMHGLRRSRSATLRQASALTGKDLLAVLHALSSTEWTERRNRAIFALGWSAAMRLSELCALNIEDLKTVDGGLVVTIKKSKTDQEGRSAAIGLPNSELTEIILEWNEAVKKLYGLDTGPLWPRIGAAQKDRWFPSVGRRRRLSVRGMSQIIKNVLQANGLKGSSHSLRRGLISEAAAAGVPELIIQRHSRHKSLTVLRSYVEAGNIMIDNPLPAVFDRLFGEK